MILSRKTIGFMCLFFSSLLLLLSSCSKEEKENFTEIKENFTITSETLLPVTESVETKEDFSKTPLMYGIDVSKWQGEIDWEKLKNDGVEFAMIRLGYSDGSGNFYEDPYFTKNMENADKNGVLTGVYFYSQAKNEEIAVAEANFILSKIAAYSVSFPVVMDYEWTGDVADLSSTQRTDIALSFLEVIEKGGYEPMLYVPIEELEDVSLWDKERVFEKVMVWGAAYDTPTYPEREHPDLKTNYAMWQYSNTGRKDGIYGDVDLNLAYFFYTEIGK